MAAEIIARFADGRLLVRQEKIAESNYTNLLAVRVGLVGTVERVISLDAYLSGYPVTGRLLAPLGDVGTSGDVVCVKLYRDDLHLATFASGQVVSGYPAFGVLSNITSGLAWHGAITSGLISGQVNVILNVVGL